MSLQDAPSAVVAARCCLLVSAAVLQYPASCQWRTVPVCWPVLPFCRIPPAISGGSFLSAGQCCRSAVSRQLSVAARSCLLASAAVLQYPASYQGRLVPDCWPVLPFCNIPPAIRGGSFLSPGQCCRSVVSRQLSVAARSCLLVSAAVLPYPPSYQWRLVAVCWSVLPFWQIPPAIRGGSFLSSGQSYRSAVSRQLSVAARSCLLASAVVLPYPASYQWRIVPVCWPVLPFCRIPPVISGSSFLSAGQCCRSAVSPQLSVADGSCLLASAAVLPYPASYQWRFVPVCWPVLSYCQIPPAISGGSLLFAGQCCRSAISRQLSVAVRSCLLASAVVLPNPVSCSVASLQAAMLSSWWWLIKEQ